IVAVGLISSLALLSLTFFPILFFPAIVLTIVLYVAIPVAVAEQPSIVGSLRRSAELSYGHRWQIFSILIVQVMVILVGAQILSLAFGEQGESPTMAYILTILGLQVVVGIAGSILTGVTYFHLARPKLPFVG
ncbi:MAG: hypothetical protein JKY56_23220, partial [Kofleriaceae bacterium]|nr:hypothetical protein [Kofleriaceae bacterium]